MKHSFHLFTLTVLLLLNHCPAFAQVISFNKVIQVEEIPNIITGITQDREGNIWFSATGISRYDGVQLKTYSNDPLNPNSISNNRVECITADKSGNIWAGTYGGGLDKFDPKTGIFTHYKHNENDPASISSDTVLCIIEDRDGIIWLGTDMKGLNRLDPATGKFTHFRHKENDPASLSFDQVRVIYEDKKSVIWIGCGGPFFENQPGKNGGLNRMDKKSGKFTTYLHKENDPHSLIDNRVRAILEDSHGNFWIGTAGDGLHTMNRDAGTFERHTYDPKYPDKLSRPALGKFYNFGDDHITFIKEDITGNIWIGTYMAGLTNYDPVLKKITRYNSQKSTTGNFSDSTTWCTFTSRDGVLWIGTWNNGLYRADPSHQNIQHTEVYTGRRVFAFLEEPGPVQYIGTDSGLVRIDKKNNSRQIFLHDHKSQESISDNFVFTLFKDSKNRIWAGTSGFSGGLNLFNPEKQSFTRFKHDPKNSNSLSSDFVFTIYEDHHSNVWFGTLDGLDKMNEQGSFTHYKSFPGDTVGQRNLVACILEDSKQNIWFGNVNEGGLHMLDQKSGQVKNYLSRHNVIDVKQDSEGKLWAGAEDGLYTYDQGLDSFFLFTDPSSGTSFNTIGITEDKNKNLWVSSTSGLYRINKDRNEVSRFSKNFGINPVTFNGIRLYTSGEGQLFINTVNGYYSFFPDKITSNLNPPEIVFTDFRVANQHVTLKKVSSLKEDLYQAKKIELSYNQDAFSFLFNITHFSNPDANRVIYMLENYDEQWRNAGSERIAYYYNIPPGDYRFRVKAASSNGVWTEKSIAVLVKPPWWRSWWAFMLYGCLLIGLAVLVHHTLKQRVIFKERERTRSRELAQAKKIEKAYNELKTTQGQLIQSEKMASLGELTAGIAHEIQNPLNFVNNFSEINTELVEELEKEADKGNMEEVKSIAKDIKENSEKINHHGKRADSIVKGMLQHSKSNNAIKEPTDINKIADEYLRLAYHGLRAKDKSFNASMKTAFDESIGPVTVIPQEIGRVFLNIINNAFYVVAEKKKQSLNGYEPTVSIQTKKKNGQVEITIKDNGNGIPPKALDKIFQPFFTTKPTGQGTGLGLSLSYDIIKAHGGEINVQTKEGEGTEFIIQLPIPV